MEYTYMLTETHLSFFQGVRRWVEDKKNENDQMVITGSQASPDIFANMYYYYLHMF